MAATLSYSRYYFINGFNLDGKNVFIKYSNSNQSMVMARNLGGSSSEVNDDENG